MAEDNDRCKHLFFILTWVLVAAWMGAILYFSSLKDPFFFIEKKNLGNNPGVWFHLGEYAGLAVCLYLAARLKSGAFLPLGVGLSFALIDELSQKSVPNRHFAVTDVIIDLAGIAGALLLIKIWKYGRLKLIRVSSPIRRSAVFD